MPALHDHRRKLPHPRPGRPPRLPRRLRQHPVVLFFYPRADTPGCTIEACAFRDAITDLKAAGVTVLGISRDTVKAQKKFADKFHLPYPLLADPDEKICNYFDLIKPKNMYGKLVKGVERTTYLIAPADAEGHQRLAPRLAQGETRGPRRRSPHVAQQQLVNLTTKKAALTYWRAAIPATPYLQSTPFR